MALSRSEKIERRNEKILAQYLRGWTYQRIADHHGISTSLVYQVLTQTGADRKAA